MYLIRTDEMKWRIDTFENIKKTNKLILNYYWI